jgi:hypothetical protein
MNNRGLSIFTMFIWLVLIVFIWFVFLASVLTQAGNDAITNGGLTGIEGFFYANLNLIIIFVPLLLWVLAGLFTSGS